jgi:hypothetical protein
MTIRPEADLRVTGFKRDNGEDPEEPQRSQVSAAQDHMQYDEPAHHADERDGGVPAEGMLLSVIYASFLIDKYITIAKKDGIP